MVKNMPIFIINPQNIYIIRYMTTPDLSIEKRLHTHTIQVLLTDRKCVILRQRREAWTTHKYTNILQSRRHVATSFH